MSGNDDDIIVYGGAGTPYEEIRILHSRLAIKIKLSDIMRLLIGQRPLMAFCVRLIITKDKDDKFIDIDTDMYGSKIIVASKDEVIETKDAVFDYDELHR